MKKIIALLLIVPAIAAVCRAEFIYVQKTGELWHAGILLTKGYSGAGEHKNNPDSQCIEDLGPIPRGKYTIAKTASTDNGWKPEKLFIRLTPASTNEMCGRDKFLFHGDSGSFPGWASAGCIIISDKNIRQKILDAAAAGDNQLTVVKDKYTPPGS